MSSRPGMSESASPLQNLLARAGGIHGLVSTALPVAAFAPASALFG